MTDDELAENYKDGPEHNNLHSYRGISMNISRIRQLITDGDLSTGALRYLLDCHGECEYLDFKETIEIDTDHGCACFSRDALGMKNVGGGYIVVGVRDKTWEPVGLSQRLTYDTKLIRDKIRKGTGLDLEADIVQHEIYINGSSILLAFILIRSSIKRSKLRVPSLAKINFHQNESWGIRQGDIYVRIGDSTKKIDSDVELQDLLDNLEERQQEDEIERANSIPSPFAVEAGLFRLLPQEYAKFVGREKYKELLKKAVESDPRIWIINLYGPGGVGKSALATWLAYEYYREQRPFEAILHLSAKDLELSSEGIRHLQPTLVSLEDLLDRILHLFEHSEYCKADIDIRKRTVVEILSAYRTLLILDNMEAVSDGRIMEFVRALPPTNQAKVLVTSRRRTSEWEYPIQVTEFDEQEVGKFIEVRNSELGLNLPVYDPMFVNKMSVMSGGLPLAIQWTLGEYAKTKDLDKILSRALTSDSPLLEFSFRNLWGVLDGSSQKAMAVLSIFDNPPTSQEWRTALDWSVEKIEKATSSLIEVTFVSERPESKTGKKIYSALPITLTFARNELAKMGSLEAKSRLRYQDYKNRLELASVETAQYSDLFERFEAKHDVQKKAIIFCRMAEGQARSLGYQAAGQFYSQAIEIDPRSVYALVSFGLFKAELGNFGEAIELITQATKNCSKKTGYYVYFNLSRVYDQFHDRPNRIRCLRKALEYEPKHTIARHSLAVALSQSGNYDEAILIFDYIIADELGRSDGPTESLIYAYKTKIITLQHAKREIEAKEAIQEAIERIKSFDHLEHLVYRLDDLIE
jgi:tetratricopeptide (TPR) repeat protein